MASSARGRLLARAAAALAVAALASDFSSSLASPSTGNKVHLALYYESLCPYSARFVVNYLAKIFDDGLIGIVDLELVPYGNAHVRNGTITCQHGEYECLLNTVEACAIHEWPDLKTHFGFINCVEKLVVERRYREWESCFGETGLNQQVLTHCLETGLGKELELQYRDITNSLEPPHKYVPWVVVDGLPLYEDYENFEAYVCQAYKGSNSPKVCGTVALQMPRSSSSNLVSYDDEAHRTAIGKDETTIIRAAL